MHEVGMFPEGLKTQQDVVRFQEQVYHVYREHKRHFAWRETHDPYCIFVSEVMLQQTQVARVITKYEEFIQNFPTVYDLAQATSREVLEVWVGLGYNRRAQSLHNSAQVICAEHGGIVPGDTDTLDALPGIGINTAGSIAAFAFNKPTVFIETNIRSVFLHAFFPAIEKVSDHALISLIAQTLDVQNPREWYYALMDYGALLKRILPNPGRRSKHHAKQSRFEGSLRQVRGALIRCLVVQGPLCYEELLVLLKYDAGKVQNALHQLCEEQLIKKENNLFFV